jgi:uncharacterized membrane-anchored protein
MSSVIVNVSDKLMESINKSKAVVDLLGIANYRNLAENTLPDIGWLLRDELKRMEEQVDRLPAKYDS